MLLLKMRYRYVRDRAEKRAWNSAETSSPVTTEISSGRCVLAAFAVRLGRRSAGNVDRDDVRERVHPGIRAAADGEAPDRLERLRRARLEAAPSTVRSPGCAAQPRNGVPSYSSVSLARQAALTPFVRSALCSIALHTA